MQVIELQALLQTCQADRVDSFECINHECAFFSTRNGLDVHLLLSHELTFKPRNEVSVPQNALQQTTISSRLVGAKTRLTLDVSNHTNKIDCHKDRASPLIEKIKLRLRKILELQCTVYSMKS